MLLIECPYCGPRDETEYRHGGQAHVPYPADPEALSDREWAEYLFYRDNPRGVLAERWLHTAGCRRWFNSIRDTETYEISAVYPIGAERPGTAAEASPGSALSAPGPAHHPKGDPAARAIASSGSHARTATAHTAPTSAGSPAHPDPAARGASDPGDSPASRPTPEGDPR